MKDNELQKKLTKILTLSEILIEEIDHPVKTPNKTTKEIQDKARELQDLLIPVVNRFYSQEQLKKSIVYQTITKKFDYAVNKELKIKTI